MVKEATTLGGAGYNVTVLGVHNHGPSVAIDSGLLAGAPFRVEALDLLPGHGVASFHRRLKQRLWRDVAERWGWKTIHAVGPATALLAHARRFPADLTIVHNEIAHWAGLRLLAAGRKVAADFEDWHSEDLLPADRAGRPLPLLRRIENDLLHSARYTSTTSAALADALHSRYGGKRPVVITNSFPLQRDPRTLRPAPTAGVRYVWFSQTIGPGRGLEPFLTAWSRTIQKSRLTLLGECRADFRAQLLTLVPAAKRAQVEFLPSVPPGQLPSEIAHHDVGLALEDSAIVNRDLTITNKILQYLNAGLAVAASDTAGQREVLARSPQVGVLIRLDDPIATAQALDDLAANRNRLRSRQLTARQLAEEVYCWEREEPRLLALVKTALGQSGTHLPDNRKTGSRA